VLDDMAPRGPALIAIGRKWTSELTWSSARGLERISTMRTISVLLAVGAVALVLLACGSGESSSTPEQRAAVVAVVEEEVSDELTDVEVSEVEIDGDAATARVTGSDALDGEIADFTVELVDDGGWKVDGFR
jgi:hypothetical protein